MDIGGLDFNKAINTLIKKINNLLSDYNEFDSTKYFNDNTSLFAAAGVISGIAILINTFIDQHTFLDVPNGTAIVTLLRDAVAASFLIYLLISIYIIYRLLVYKPKYDEKEKNDRDKLSLDIESGNITNDTLKFVSAKVINFLIKNVILIGFILITFIIGLYILLTMLPYLSYCLDMFGFAFGIIFCIAIAYLSRNVNNWVTLLIWFIIGLITLSIYVVTYMLYNIIPLVSFTLGIIGIIMLCTSVVQFFTNIIYMLIKYKQKPIDEKKGLSTLPFYIVFMVIFIIYASVSTTMNKDDSSLIIGQWNSYNANDQIKYIFNPDHTFSAYYDNMKVSGMWVSYGNLNYGIAVNNSDNSFYLMNVTINKQSNSLESDYNPVGLFNNNTEIKYELFTG